MNENKSVTSIANATLVDLGAGVYATRVTGTLTSTSLAIVYSYSGNVTETLTVNGQGIFITNDGTESITMTVGLLDITINQNESFEGTFSPFTEIDITIPTVCNYRIVVLN